uniref:Uncharacterized protein n=1 Tax=Glossina pallidipes TaxID=7398 RepID=A0A1B0A0X7_GLOPL
MSFYRLKLIRRIAFNTTKTFTIACVIIYIHKGTGTYFVRRKKDSNIVKGSFCETPRTSHHTHYAFKYYLRDARLTWLIRAVLYRNHVKYFAWQTFAVIISFRLLVNDTCLCRASLTDMRIAIISILSDYSFDFYRLKYCKYPFGCRVGQHLNEINSVGGGPLIPLLSNTV